MSPADPHFETKKFDVIVFFWLILPLLFNRKRKVCSINLSNWQDKTATNQNHVSISCHSFEEIGCTVEETCGGGGASIGDKNYISLMSLCFLADFADVWWWWSLY